MIYGYARVSTEEQAAGGVSLDAQASAIGAWAAARGGPFRVLSETGSAARADNRPVLASLLAELRRSGRGAVLVVYSLSRLSRSVRDTLELGEALGRAGVELVSLRESIDTTGACGRMIFNMLAVLNQFERELIGERTAAALAHKRERGEVYGEIPFGYRRIGNKLVADSNAQAALFMIREGRETGSSYRKIAEWLEQAGIRTAKRFERWDARTVQRIYERDRRVRSGSAAVS